MSRFCAEVDPNPIFSAAAHWRDAALLGGGSVLTDKELWTDAALTALEQFYVQRPDEGEGKFLEKLKIQLAPSGAETIQLAAEMMWLLYLCPSSITPPRKRQTIQAIWAWSGDVFPADSPYLNDQTLRGIGSAGPGFNQNQWRELVFCIATVREFRSVPPSTQQSLLTDAWEFDRWLSGVKDAESRQFRHMLLFMLFPDEFERVFGQTERRAVAFHFSRKDRKEVSRMDNLQLDRELRQIRAGLESKFGRTDLDYYTSPLKEDWKAESFNEATAGITQENVEAAIKQIDREGVPSSAQSMGYDLVHQGKKYPPKYVLSVAVGVASGEPLDRNGFSGGEESACFRLLRQLGFEIVPKESEEAGFTEQLHKFLMQAGRGDQLSTQSFVREYRGLRVKVSFGQGAFARVPWMALLGGEQRVSKGIYPVLLLFKSEGHLLLCYGISETEEPDISWAGMEGKRTVTEWFQSQVGRPPPRYGRSFVEQAYAVDGISLADVQKRLDDVIDRYTAQLSIEPPDPAPLVPPGQNLVDVEDDLPARANLEDTADAFAEALLECGVNFGERHSTTVSAFVASLATKPLVILTGLSGSGKSQIAVRFGEWLGSDRLHVAAVRPDWTGSEALFGYEDGLKPASEGRPAWHVPATLEFILRAHHDPQHPYLLVLDEMNLAHVERYFADVLSGMESGQPCIPSLSRGSDGCWRSSGIKSGRVVFPRNLWIVGTVNVDETTYMFSPKVLDRASTLEFRVETGDLTLSPRKPKICSPGDPNLVRGLQVIARDDEWHVNQPFSAQADLIKRLHQLHNLLSRHNLEFGHRVFYEAVRFGAMVEKAGVKGIDSVLDLIVIQKVLPRLHGSRRRLEPPLLALLGFCRDPSDDSSSETGPDDESNDPPTPPRLGASHRKLSRMLRNLRANQFASFAE